MYVKCEFFNPMASVKGPPPAICDSSRTPEKRGT